MSTNKTKNKSGTKSVKANKAKASKAVNAARASVEKTAKLPANADVKSAGKRVVAARKVVTPVPVEPTETDTKTETPPALKKARTTRTSSLPGIANGVAKGVAGNAGKSKSSAESSASAKSIHDRPQTTSEWAHIRHSKIHGRGIVATKDIPSGTRIIEYEGERISKAVSERRDEEREARAKAGGDGCVYIFEINKRTDLDGHMEWNTARLINHSCEPNCQSENLRGHIWLSAVRDIAAGEELTFDYGFDVENWKDHRCLCGSPKCVGYIVAKSHRWRLKKKLKKEKQALRAARVK